MKGSGQRTLFMAKSGWYHGASQASVPGRGDGGFLFLYRLMKIAASFVLGLKISSTYPEGYACGVSFAGGLAGRQF
jgi:hypothetical protein